MNKPKFVRKPCIDIDYIWVKDTEQNRMRHVAARWKFCSSMRHMLRYDTTIKLL